MLQGPAYILIPITDLTRSVSFYRDLLGLPLVWLEEGQGHAAVETAGLLLVLSAHEPVAGPCGPVLAFAVEDIEGAYATLRDKGMGFPKGIEEHGGRRTARFTDPDGNPLELNQTKHPPQR